MYKIDMNKCAHRQKRYNNSIDTKQSDKVFMRFQDKARFEQRKFEQKKEHGLATIQVYLSVWCCLCEYSKTEALISPFSNSEVMIKHLKLISDATSVE